MVGGLKLFGGHGRGTEPGKEGTETRNPQRRGKEMLLFNDFPVEGVLLGGFSGRLRS